MYGVRGNRAGEKTALMPDPLRRSSFGCGTLDSRRMDMDMVRPRKDPWGLSPVGGPWEAWGSLMDLCGRSRPVEPPRHRVTPMLAVYATATVGVTVAAGTRCAWYGLTGPLDAERW